jgi:hypothetical protein
MKIYQWENELNSFEKFSIQYSTMHSILISSTCQKCDLCELNKDFEIMVLTSKLLSSVCFAKYGNIV